MIPSTLRLAKRIDVRDAAYYNGTTNVGTREEMVRAQRSIGIRELKEHATEIVRQVREKGVVVQITYRGQVVAQLLPVRPPRQSAKEVAAVWTNLDQLAAEIGASWPSGVSAAEAVREGRRDL